MHKDKNEFQKSTYPNDSLRGPLRGTYIVPSLKYAVILRDCRIFNPSKLA